MSTTTTTTKKEWQTKILNKEWESGKCYISKS